MGMLLAALGGAADQGIDMIDKRMAEDTRIKHDKSMAEFNAELANQKAIALDKLKTESTERQRVATQARQEQEAQSAEQGGKEIQAKREIDTATQRAPSVDASAMGLINSNLTPAQKEKYYGIEATDAVGQLDDQITAARNAGNYDTVATLRSARKDALDQLKADRKDTVDNRRVDVMEERNDIQSKRIEAAIAKSGSGAHADKNLLPTIDGMRKDVADEASKINGLMKSEMATAVTPKAKQAVKDAYQPQLDALDARRKQLAVYYDFALEKVGLPVPKKSTENSNPSPKDVGKSTITSLPKGAVQIGTSGGKPVYQTPDGKKFKAD